MADVYAIVACSQADGGLIVYGYRHSTDEWIANWSARHVIQHLLEIVRAVGRQETIEHVAEVVAGCLNGHEYE